MDAVHGAARDAAAQRVGEVLERFPYALPAAERSSGQTLRESRGAPDRFASLGVEVEDREEELSSTPDARFAFSRADGSPAVGKTPARALAPITPPTRSVSSGSLSSGARTPCSPPQLDLTPFDMPKVLPSPTSWLAAVTPGWHVPAIPFA